MSLQDQQTVVLVIMKTYQLFVLTLAPAPHSGVVSQTDKRCALFHPLEYQICGP